MATFSVLFSILILIFFYKPDKDCDRIAARVRLMRKNLIHTIFKIFSLQNPLPADNTPRLCYLKIHWAKRFWWTIHGSPIQSIYNVVAQSRFFMCFFTQTWYCKPKIREKESKICFLFECNNNICWNKEIIDHETTNTINNNEIY